MRAILIKPDGETVEEVQFNGTLDHAYELLGCTIIERVTLESGEDVWFDEEGLINDSSLGTFDIEGFSLAGRGLVTGTAKDEDGEETFGDATSDPETIRKAVEFNIY